MCPRPGPEAMAGSGSGVRGGFDKRPVNPDDAFGVSDPLPWAASLLARLECLVEAYGTLRGIPVERQGEEEFRSHPLQHKRRRALEAELPVVLGMPDMATSLGVQVLQSG